MDESPLIPDIWTRIIPLLPLESAATASLVCRYLRDRVACDWSTLAKVPQLWRNFATKSNLGAGIEPYPEPYGREARFFVRELVRQGIHEVPALTTYMSPVLEVRGDLITGFSLVPHYFNRPVTDGGQRNVKNPVDFGLGIGIAYRLYRHVYSRSAPTRAVPIRADEPRWTIVEETWLTTLIGGSRPASHSWHSYRTLSLLFLDPLNTKKWFAAKKLMAESFFKFPEDTPYRT